MFISSKNLSLLKQSHSIQRLTKVHWGQHIHDWLPIGMGISSQLQLLCHHTGVLETPCGDWKCYTSVFVCVFIYLLFFDNLMNSTLLIVGSIDYIKCCFALKRNIQILLLYCTCYILWKHLLMKTFNSKNRLIYLSMYAN
jgi:hypothetical protein